MHRRKTKAGKISEKVKPINYKDNGLTGLPTRTVRTSINISRDRKSSNHPADNPILTPMVTENLLYGQTPRPPSKFHRMKPATKLE
jgi:hypothetical protein